MERAIKAADVVDRNRHRGCAGSVQRQAEPLSRRESFAPRSCRSFMDHSQSALPSITPSASFALWTPAGLTVETRRLDSLRPSPDSLWRICPMNAEGPEIRLIQLARHYLRRVNNVWAHRSPYRQRSSTAWSP